MRFTITILLAMGLIVMTMLGQKNEPLLNRNATSILKHEDSNLKSDPFNEYTQDSLAEPLKNSDPWQKFKPFLNKVLISILAGWAFGRLFIQVRRIVLFFIGLFIIFDFVLMLGGIIKITFTLELIRSTYQTVQAVIDSIGLESFISILLGFWVGVKGFPS